MSFALRCWKIIVQKEMGFSLKCLRLDGFSSILHWWLVSIKMADDSSVRLEIFLSVKEWNWCVWEAGWFYRCHRWVISIHRGLWGLPAPFSCCRLPRQMEGRVAVARLMLSSGLKCNLDLQAAGLVYGRSLRSILQWQGNSSAQACWSLLTD